MFKAAIAGWTALSDNASLLMHSFSSFPVFPLSSVPFGGYLDSLTSCCTLFYHTLFIYYLRYIKSTSTQKPQKQIWVNVCFIAETVQRRLLTSSVWRWYSCQTRQRLQHAHNKHQYYVYIADNDAASNELWTTSYDYEWCLPRANAAVVIGSVAPVCL